MKSKILILLAVLASVIVGYQVMSEPPSSRESLVLESAVKAIKASKGINLTKFDPKQYSVTNEGEITTVTFLPAKSAATPSRPIPSSGYVAKVKIKTSDRSVVEILGPY